MSPNDFGENVCSPVYIIDFFENEGLRATAGLPEVRLHDLRHSFASMAAPSGASLPMIGKLVGHSQPQTTQRYAHLADDPVSELNNEVSARIAAAIGSRPPNAE